MNAIELVRKQREYYLSGNTLSYESRIDCLDKLHKTIKQYEEEVLLALEKDLDKSRVEAFFSEVGQVYKELSFMKKNLKKLMKIKKVKSEFSDFPSKSFISPHPYGVVLVISPWNYPFLLTLNPVIGAIAAGNTVIVKPSEYSTHTSEIIDKIMSVFDDIYIKVVQGGVEETTQLLNEKLDYIFFTGSTAVGKIIMEKASQNLTPVSLELGGKSPTIVDKTANLKITAKRIAFGKHLNSGQTCIAPDYLLIHKDVKEEFLNLYIAAIKELYGEDPIQSKDYGKIITKKHYQRLIGLLDQGDTIFGGNYDEQASKIAPTIIEKLPTESKIMNQEIFGPILPVIEYDTIDEVVKYINSRSTPLALYLFSEDKQIQDYILDQCNFGGGCINDTIVQAASHYLPFGGVGESGMGSYHGIETFKTFTHYRSIIKKSTKFDLKTRYAPYQSKTEKLLRKILK